MTPSHWYVLLVYFGFTFIATLLAFARRWLRPEAGGESVWRKYPTYILINLSFLAASWLPPAWHILTVLLMLLGGLAAWEIAQALFPAPRQGKHKILIVLLPCTTSILTALSAWFNLSDWIKTWLLVFLLLIVLNTLTAKPDDYARNTLAIAGCGVYLPFCIAAFVWIRQADPAGFEAAFLYLVVATNDALAQITGQLFGTRQLAPQISPAKTMEGALGGLFFAGLMGAALSRPLGWSYLPGAAYGLILGLAGLAGDLTASRWKRALRLKNFSTLLGPQGGILDRFDGLLLAAPVFYLLTIWF
jgi:phosphatidate cytidylyltransferase